MRVNSRKYIQRSNPRKNKYSKKIGGQDGQENSIRQQALRAGSPISKNKTNVMAIYINKKSVFKIGDIVKVPVRAGKNKAKLYKIIEYINKNKSDKRNMFTHYKAREVRDLSTSNNLTGQVIEIPWNLVDEYGIEEVGKLEGMNLPSNRARTVTGQEQTSTTATARPATATTTSQRQPAQRQPSTTVTTQPATATARPEQRPVHLNSPSANNTFLQMLNQDVDVIALNIKKKLGITNQEASRRATELFNKMEMLKKDIYNSLHRNDDSYLEVSDNEYGNKEIKLKGNTHSIAEGKKSSERLPTDKDETINGLESIKSLDYGSGIKTLDDESNGFNNAEYMSNFTPESSVLDDNGIRKVENRLLNCQKLEYYYLKKHDEVVKLFTFILNLFDKYKYQGELLLFLLKYLVKRPIRPGADPNRPGSSPSPGPGSSPSPGQQDKPTIRIPKAIITNISKLIKDQDKIQEVINTMKTRIDNDNDNPLTRTNDNYEAVQPKVYETGPFSRDARYVESNLNSSSEV